MVIVLAVAFFMSLLLESAVSRSVGIGLEQEVRQQQLSQTASSDWFDKVTAKTMADRLVAGGQSQARLAEIAAITHQPTERLAALSRESVRNAQFDGFFEDLDAGSRAALVGKIKGEAIDERLGDPQAWDEFAGQLKHLFVLHPPMPMDQMHEVVARHPGLVRELDEVADGWNASIASLLKASGEKGLGGSRQECLDMLQGANEAQIDAFTQLLHEHGFTEDRDTVARIHAQLALAGLEQAVRERLMTDDMSTAWRKTFLESPPIEQKMQNLGRDGVAALLGNDQWTQAMLAGISSQIASDHRRLAIAKEVSGRIGKQQEGSGRALLSERQAFLMAISFVVCMVGITNAMLMAITERFREIATMKCLGATDGFILQQFLIEAAMQGLAGGVAGMLIGGVLSLLKCLMLYGGYLITYFPVGGIFAAGGLCILAGIVLSTLASIYPSWMASRMAPMEAMRIE